MSSFNWTSTYINEDLKDLVNKPTALIVVDMQNDFASKKGRFVDAYGLHIGAVVQKTKNVIDEFHRVKLPVIFTRMVYRPDYSDAGKRARSRSLGALKEGSWGAEIVDELKPMSSDYIINKQRASSFYQTNLDLLLKNLRTETLVVSGIATNVCVESTVRDALFRDYDCIVLADCVATKDEETQNSSLRFMNEFAGIVTSSDNLLKTMKGKKRVSRA